MLFYLGLHDLYVVLSWFTRSVCCFILVYTICMLFYLGLHNLCVVLSWFTQSSQLFHESIQVGLFSPRHGVSEGYGQGRI